MIGAGQAANQQPVKLYTPAELAEVFGVEERTVLDWRRDHGWPSVLVGRTVRFTQAQVDDILARQTHEPGASTSEGEQLSLIPGQSKRSAARAS